MQPHDHTSRQRTYQFRADYSRAVVDYCPERRPTANSARPASVEEAGLAFRNAWITAEDRIRHRPGLILIAAATT